MDEILQRENVFPLRRKETIMEKAYDPKLLLEKLKEEGLEVAEDAAESVYSAVKNWLVHSAKISANPIDDILVSLVDHIDELVLEQIDKINPDDNDTPPAA